MRILTFLTAIALTILATATTGASPRTATPPNPQLRLHRGAFDARVDGRALAPELAAAAPGPYAIFQLRGPITTADRDALEQTGVTLLEYLPDYAYLVRGSAIQLEAAATLPQVYARVPFTIADKLALALLRALQRGQDELGSVRITGWPGDTGTLARDLATMAVEPETAADASLLLALANLESVRWIEPAGRPRLLNDHARSIMSVDSAWQDHGLFGSGQVIAIADSGLDTGSTATLSPDFAGRLAASHALATGGHWDDNHGHGTHVAGSAVGAGVQSGAEPGQHQYAGSFAGMAPAASLVIQAFEVLSDGSIEGLDPDHYTLFQQAYADGARLHSNSWGDTTGPAEDPEAAFGGYPYGAQRTDQFLWDHPDMAIFAAAGNSGVDGTPGVFGFCLDGDGVIDLDSLLSPATAKNVITVGAGESDRSEGGLGNVPWVLIGTCFFAAPIAGDPLANNADGMAAFSSRGPADDGRLKPDLVAPGTNIVSNRSHTPGATTLWGVHESNADYVYSGGTSMATPLAAGGGVLVREWLATHGLANPSAAAVKATLLNTTRDTAPGQYGTGATQEIPSHYPNPVTGWGRADLGFVSAPAPYTLWLDDHTAGITTGQSINYADNDSRPLAVVSSAQPLRIMLAWTDPPASLSAAAQLVNDLDLVLVGPDGTTYQGNGVAAGDRTNNVEGIILNNPPLGQYQVQVHAFNVPLASQPYALVVAGPLGEAPPTASQYLFLPLVRR